MELGTWNAYNERVIRRPAVIFLTLAFVSAQSVEEYTRQASQLVFEYRWEEAASLLRQGLARHPDHPEMLLQLGSLLVRLGRLKEGERLLQKALQVEPASAEALHHAGVAQLRQGHFSSAISLFKESLRHSAGDAESHHRLAFALLAQGDEPLALAHARQAVELNPLETRYRRLYSTLLDLDGKAEESYRQLKFAYGIAPRDPQLLFQLAEKRRLAGDLFQALEYLELAIEEDPENPLYHRKLGDLYERLGEEGKARQEILKAEDLIRAFQHYVTALGLSRQGQQEEVLHILEPLTRQHPEFVTGVMLLADVYEKMGKEDQALALYLKILEMHPHSSAARERGAWIQLRRGLFDSAQKLLESARVSTPNQLLAAAYRKLAQEDWAGAVHYLHKVEFQYPLNVNLLQMISFCLQAQGRTEEALHYLAKAERIRPGDAETRRQILEIKFGKALDLLSKRRWRSALRAFQELLREDVQADYILRMAYCHQQLGELQQAVEKYSAGLEADPGAAWARVNLAACLYLQRKYAAAAGQWERILSALKTSDSYFQLGLCYAHLERFPEAEYAFHKAFELGDRRPEVLYHLGLALIQNKKTDDAWHLIQSAALSGYGPARDLLATAQKPRFTATTRR